MKIQDYIADSAREAADMAFKYANTVPQDKLDWRPLDQGRSVIDMCRELGMTPTWGASAFQDSSGEWNEETAKAQRQLMESWKTVDDCVAQFNDRFSAWEKVARSMSDEELSKTKWLPYNGGRDHTYLEMLDYVRWNCTYHLGQIAYIQTLYGDKEMH
jgi:uncharacterized damage-inducible protein DinB